MCLMKLPSKDHCLPLYSKYMVVFCISISLTCQLTISTHYHQLQFRLRGKVVLKGRRPVGATDDYDTDNDADDDEMTELQSVWTEKTTVTGSVSTYMQAHMFCIPLMLTNNGLYLYLT